MNLSELYTDCFPEDLEKIADAEYQEDDMEKVAASYVELGREKARADFSAIEAEAAEELEKLGYVIEPEYDKKDLIMARMEQDPEYAQALINKYSE